MILGKFGLGSQLSTGKLIAARLKEFPKRLGQFFREPKKLLPVLGMVALWLITYLLRAFGVNGIPTKMLSFLTFAGSSSFSNPLALLGGLVGKGIFAAAVTSVISLLANKKKTQAPQPKRSFGEMLKGAFGVSGDTLAVHKGKLFINGVRQDSLPGRGKWTASFRTKSSPRDEREEFVRKSKSLHVGRERHFTLDKRWNEGTEEHPHYLNFQGHAICETDENGQPAYVINAVYDVTREKEEYQATRVIEHKYKAILCDPFVPMSLYDRKGNLLDHNDAMNQLLSGIDSSLFKEVFKPEERPDVTFTRHLYYPEYGIDKYVECHIQPLYDAKGEMANYLVTTKSLPPAT